MSFGLFIGLILLAAAIAYVLRIGPARHWRRGDRLQRDWQRERQQLMESLHALQPPREESPAPPASGHPASGHPAGDQPAAPPAGREPTSGAPASAHPGGEEAAQERPAAERTDG